MFPLSRHDILHFLHRSAPLFTDPALGEEAIGKIHRYGAVVGSVIEQHARLDRCMDRLRELIRAAEEDGSTLASGTVVLAGTLNGSNGRFDRNWYAPPGGLWLALAWADTLLPRYSSLIPLAVGVACCETARFLQVEKAAIKWVNDIHVRGRKLCGVLAQTHISPGGERFHLLGIGMNVNNSRFPAELDGLATSIALETGREVDLGLATRCLLARLSWNLGLVHFQEELELENDREVDLVLAGWRRLSDSAGKRVRYGFDVQRSPLYEAMVEGVDNQGGLILRLDNGGRTVEYSGEIVYL
ncbi:biotin--[acetyl-CoA-carboxylase] ligase [Desulfolithobacter sp.]